MDIAYLCIIQFAELKLAIACLCADSKSHLVVTVLVQQTLTIQMMND